MDTDVSGGAGSRTCSRSFFERYTSICCIKTYGCNTQPPGVNAVKYPPNIDPSHARADFRQCHAPSDTDQCIDTVDLACR